jgi:hypothetical protein
MRLRQIALVAKELDSTVDDLTSIFGIDAGWADPGVGEFGLHNAVIPLGDTYLEVVSPKQDGTTAERLIQKRGGDGGYMVILQAEDIEKQRALADENNIRRIWNTDYPDARAFHMHPKDIGGPITSVDQMTPPESWKWAGPDWEARVKTDRISTIVGADVQSDDPEKMATLWAAVLGRESAAVGENTYQITFDDDSFVRFIPDRDGRGEGLNALSVKTTDSEAVLAAARERNATVQDDSIEVCGTWFHLA